MQSWPHVVFDNSTIFKYSEISEHSGLLIWKLQTDLREHFEL